MEQKSKANLQERMGFGDVASHNSKEKTDLELKIQKSSITLSEEISLLR